jgi:hypothetical protein
MCKDILEGIRELESVDIAKTELDVSINNKFRQTKNFTTEMERIPEAGLLALLRCQCPI